MMRSLENLIGYQIAATNGTMGTVSDFFFVDDEWCVRYLVVAAGGWLKRRNVLLAVDAVQEVDDSRREIRVGLTRELVFASPEVDTDMPVTRQKETLLARHYGWQPYWTPDPFFAGNVPSDRLEISEELEGSNPHLRSFRELTAYSVAGDGYVIDLIANDLNWHVDGLGASKTRGRVEDGVFIPAGRVEAIDWKNRSVRVSGGPEAPPLAPYDPAAGVNPRPVITYYDYCGRLHHVTVLPEVTERNY